MVVGHSGRFPLQCLIPQWAEKNVYEEGLRLASTHRPLPPPRSPSLYPDPQLRRAPESSQTHRRRYLAHVGQDKRILAGQGSTLCRLLLPRPPQGTLRFRQVLQPSLCIPLNAMYRRFLNPNSSGFPPLHSLFAFVASALLKRMFLIEIHLASCLGLRASEADATGFERERGYLRELLVSSGAFLSSSLP